MITFVHNDGGREAAGFKGTAGDCVCRAVAIASGRPYREVYERLAAGNANQRRGNHEKRHDRKLTKSARNGIYTDRKWFKDYMQELGFTWVTTMGIGTGCQTHLCADELPAKGRLVLKLSRHCAAVVDGELHDNHDCSREGTRCVYGYWIKQD